MGDKQIMFIGSSPTFINYGSGSFGPVGPTGPTGATGPTGPTGECLMGNTGYGIINIGIIGNDLGITFGSGNTLTLILNSFLKGPTGTTKSNATSFNIRGTTTEGIYVIKTFNLAEFAANSVTYDILTTATPPQRVVQLRGLTFRNILVSNSAAGITLTGITQSGYNFQGNTGDLAYVGGVSGTIFLKGADGNRWDQINKNITIITRTSKEKDVSGTTQNDNNYRTSGIGPVTGQTVTDMAITGYTFNCINALPISTVDGTTFTQHGLYIKEPSTGNIEIQGLYFSQQQAITSSNYITFSPQTAEGMTFGSCLIGITLANYYTKESCDLVCGTFNTSGSYKACCLYDYTIGGVTCINTSESECIRFMGVVGNYTCEMYEGILGLCPDDLCFSCDKGKCCFKGKCYALTELECFTQYPGSIWFDEDC